MRLVIECIGKGPRGLPAISVAHYYSQNGDSMRDPEMVFEVLNRKWYPISFQQDGGVGFFQEAVYETDKKICIRPPIVKELTAFSRVWDRNIKEQGFIEAFINQKDV